MSTLPKKSVFTRSSAWSLSAITAVISFVLPFLFVGIISLFGLILGFSNEALGDFLAYLFTGIAVAVMCFLICRAHPRSIWYTPLICNVSTLLAGLGNYFEGNSFLIITLPFVIGWILSIIASIWGRVLGRHDMADNKVH